MVRAVSERNGECLETYVEEFESKITLALNISHLHSELVQEPIFLLKIKALGQRYCTLCIVLQIYPFQSALCI